MRCRFICCAWVVLICLLSCTNNKIEKEINFLMSKPIDLCVKHLARYEQGAKMNGGDIIYHKYLQVIFVDSVTCSPCFLKQMPRWQTFIDSVRDHHIDLSFVFVFHVKRKEKDRFVESMQQDTLFHTPVYLDTTGVFLQSNPNIPQNKMLHTFLLDEDNQVILVGNPVQNRRIRELQDRILHKRE